MQYPGTSRSERWYAQYNPRSREEMTSGLTSSLHIKLISGPSTIPVLKDTWQYCEQDSVEADGQFVASIKTPTWDSAVRNGLYMLGLCLIRGSGSGSISPAYVLCWFTFHETMLSGEIVQFVYAKIWCFVSMSPSFDSGMTSLRSVTFRASTVTCSARQRASVSHGLEIIIALNSRCLNDSALIEI